MPPARIRSHFFFYSTAAAAANVVQDIFEGRPRRKSRKWRQGTSEAENEIPSHIRIRSGVAEGVEKQPQRKFFLLFRPSPFYSDSLLAIINKRTYTHDVLLCCASLSTFISSGHNSGSCPPKNEQGNGVRMWRVPSPCSAKEQREERANNKDYNNDSWEGINKKW